MKKGHETCFQCGNKGKPVELITLKGLLKPEAMRQLEPSVSYRFCQNKNCSTVYFNGNHSFMKDDVLVPIFQKEEGEKTSVCYCFGYTREKIVDEIQKTGGSTAIQAITQQIKAKRCACEFRNPQGSCCLGNVKQVLLEAQEKQLT